VWNLWRGTVLTFLEKYDFILCPTCACPAMPHGTTGYGEEHPPFSFASYCMTYNLTGWPAVVVRSGTSSEGLPIDVQVIGRPWREDVALAIAQRIETALGGWQPPPM
jgi:amidase